MASSTTYPVQTDVSDDEFEIIDSSYSTDVQPPMDQIVRTMEGKELIVDHDETIGENERHEIEPQLTEVKDLLESEIDRLTRVNEEQKREIEALMSLMTMTVMKVDLNERKNEEKMEDMRRAHAAEIAEKNEEIERLRRANEQEKKIEEYKKVFLGLRTVRFRKINGKFGAGHIGTSISSISKGGPADLAGLLEGDQLISINGVNVETKSDDAITKISEDVEDDVTLVVRFNPERLIELWPNSVHSDSNVIEKCEALRNQIVVPSII